VNTPTQNVPPERAKAICSSEYSDDAGLTTKHIEQDIRGQNKMKRLTRVDYFSNACLEYNERPCEFVIQLEGRENLTGKSKFVADATTRHPNAAEINFTSGRASASTRVTIDRCVSSLSGVPTSRPPNPRPISPVRWTRASACGFASSVPSSSGLLFSPWLRASSLLLSHRVV